MSKTIGLIWIVTIVFSLAIAFDLTPLLRGPAPYPPDWRWDYNFVNTFGRIWLPLLVAGGISWLHYQISIEKNPLKREKIILGQFVFYFFLFQLAVLFFQRSGIGVLLHRIIDNGLNGYFTTGIEIENVKTFLQTYSHHVLSFYQHAKGHPPFAVLFFYWLEQIFSIFPKITLLNTVHSSSPDISLVFNKLTSAQQLTAIFSGIFIPFLSALTTVPLYHTTKLLYGARAGFISILLYIAVPAVTLFTPLNDVFLPLFTIWSLYYLILGTKQSSNIKIFLAGLLFSIGTLFSITFLPLLLVWVTYFFVKKTKKAAVGMELSFLLGLLLIPYLLFLTTGFNMIELIKLLPKGLPANRHYFPWVFYNLYDFFIFCGIPAVILFWGNIKAKKMDVLFVSFLIMLFLLDFSGGLRGEAGRIWLPFVPLVILPASNYIAEHKFSIKEITLIFLLGIVQLLIMQEFWVTLY